LRVNHRPSLFYREPRSVVPLVLIITPLALSAFTHLWNPIGFPFFHGDEAHYLRRAMHVLQGLGPQEAKTEFERPFDHPYFGQLFLGGVFWAIGYPHFINLSITSFDGLKSIVEQLYLYPRVLMGILAILDTFLIYKITQRRYSRNAAFIAAVLFAVMPLTWLTRRVVLESIYLPFMLSSILCALYLSHHRLVSASNNSKIKRFDNIRPISRYLSRTRILTFTSGLLLGLAIFTKITAIMIIPLLLYLIFMKTDSNRLKTLRIWILPVIIIPMIWPAYALISGQLQDWIDGVLWQGDRDGRGLYRSFLTIFDMDPLLCIIGLTSIILVSAIKRDLFLLLWLVPFLLFYSLIPFIQHFHWIFILPLLCIATGVCVSDLLDMINKRKSVARAAIYSAVSALFIFGLISTILLININLNESLFMAQALIIKLLPYTDLKGQETAENVILMGSNWMQSFSWIPEYVFNKGHSFKSYLEKNLPIENENTKKILLLVDRKDQEGFSLTDQEGRSLEKERLYNNTHAIAEISEKSEYYKKLRDQYPYTSVHENRGIERGKIILKANY